MMGGFLLHVGLAFIWMFLTQGGSTEFVIGLLGTYLLLSALPNVMPVQTYLRRVSGFIRFLFVFLRELLLANFTIAHSVLFQRIESLNPGFILYPVPGLKAHEMFLLSQCITLTPGTTTIDVRVEREELLIHAYDASDPEAVRAGIDRTLKQAILAFTR